MSRVYEALRLSELETGVGPATLDPDCLLSFSTSTVVGSDQSRTAVQWNEIESLNPTVAEKSRVVALTEGNGLGAEKFRLLRARLRNLREHLALQRLVLTSAVPGDGKTMVTMNLAVSLAKHTDEKILLLEGDLRKPMVGEHLGIRGRRGLGDWCLCDEPISNFIYRLDDSQLWVLHAGTTPENPVTILQSARFLELYRHLCSCFDWIIIDAPPLVPMADVSFWSRNADGLLLVVRQGKTPKMVLRKGLETLDNPKVIGVVLNDARDIESSYYQRYHRGQQKVAG